MKWSILDQVPIAWNGTASQALQDMAKSAVYAESLGYHRFWIAEHHHTPSLASSAPEISLAYLAAKTNTIRLGTGGTMMMHYSPLKMAEVFKTLSAYAPGRIDFGAGRAPGGDQAAMLALSEGRQPLTEGLYEKLYETLHLFQDTKSGHPLYDRVAAQPIGAALPMPFMLGSTGNSAIQAAKMGLPYAYVHFFTGDLDPTILEMYRDHFQPSTFCKEPYVLVCYYVTIGETQEEADFQAFPSDIARMQLYKGILRKRMSPEAAQSFPLSENDKAFIQQMNNWQFRGTPKSTAAFLNQQAKDLGIDEIMICSIPFDQSYKLWEYEALAKELEIKK